jgi:hypothetical protein
MAAAVPTPAGTEKNREDTSSERPEKGTTKGSESAISFVAGSSAGLVSR